MFEVRLLLYSARNVDVNPLDRRLGGFLPVADVGGAWWSRQLSISTQSPARYVYLLLAHVELGIGVGLLINHMGAEGVGGSATP